MSIDRIRAALAEIPAPGGAGNILDAGMVSEVDFDDGEAIVVLKFKDVPKEDRHTVEDKVYDAIQALDGVEEATVDTVVEGGRVADPEGPGGVSPAQSNAKAGGTTQQSGRTLPGVQNVIAVASGKGGVGKSTVSANLAIALKRRGARVGVLDIDIYGPSMPILLGVPDAKPGVTPDQKHFKPVEAYGMKVMSIGFLVDDDTPVIWRGPIVGSVVKQFLDDVDWGELDYLVIDLPPGTGDAQLTLTQTAPITGAVIVTTPSELALVDAVKGLQMFRKVDTPVLGLVENMSSYVCRSCGHEEFVFNENTTEKMAEKNGVKLLTQIPIDVDIQRGGDNGKPVTEVMPDSPQAAAFLKLADSVIESCPFTQEKSAEKKGGFLSGLFRR